MMRMFKEHRVRHIESLDGIWTLKLPCDVCYPAIVPGVWETIPDLAA